MSNPNYSGPERRTVDPERTELSLSDHASRAAEYGTLLKEAEKTGRAKFSEGNDMKEAVIEEVFAENAERTRTGVEELSTRKEVSTLREEFGEAEIKQFLIEQLGIDPEQQAEEIMKGWEVRKLSQIPGLRLPNKAQILTNLYEIYKGPEGRKKLEGLKKLATKPELVIAIDANLLELIEKLDANKAAIQKNETYISPFTEEQWGAIQVPSPIELRLGIWDGADYPRVMGKDTDMTKPFGKRVEINQKQLDEYGLEFADSRVYFAGATNAIDREVLIDTKTCTLLPTDPASTKERFVDAGWGGGRLGFYDRNPDNYGGLDQFRAFGGGKMKY